MIASSARWTTRKRTESPWLKHPKGIRDVEEWYISTVTRRDYVYEVFERQCEIALANLGRIYPAVGDRVTAVFVTGTDFGMQTGPFISPKTYRHNVQPQTPIENVLAMYETLREEGRQFYFSRHSQSWGNLRWQPDVPKDRLNEALGQ